MITKIMVMFFTMLCLILDLRDGRIPNTLIIVFLLPLLFNALYAGVPEGFMSISLPLLVALFLIWSFGFLGGADVKAFLVISLALSGVAVLKIICLTTAFSVLAFLIHSIFQRKLVRSMPMMPFVAIATLVIWL